MKGQIHVEWVISLGIFLLYVLGMILFIKPGYIPYYSEKELVNLVENGLKENFYWNVKKVPLFVTTSCKCLLDNKCVFSLKDKDNKWGVNVSEGYSFEDSVSSGTVLWFSFYSNDQTKELVIKDVSSFPVDPNILDLCKSTDYLIGAAENVYGINKVPLDYNGLKETLKYPIDKDFSLSLNDNKIGNKEAPQGMNVYVKEWNDFYVSRDGERESVKVGITVW